MRIGEEHSNVKDLNLLMYLEYRCRKLYLKGGTIELGLRENKKLRESIASLFSSIFFSFPIFHHSFVSVQYVT